MIEVGRALYEPSASSEQLSLFGLTSTDYDDTVEVWPDNWQAFRLFEALSTQWRTGACGATGLDYSAIYDTASLSGFTKKHTIKLFPDLRVLEAEAMLVMSEQMNKG